MKRTRRFGILLSFIALVAGFVLSVPHALELASDARRDAADGAALLSVARRERAGRAPSRGPGWNNVPTFRLPAHVRHRTFYSPSMRLAVGYCIYLPPAYFAEPSRSFPVVYLLHGRGGSEISRDMLESGRRLHEAILSRGLPPMIMVWANGRGNTWFNDSADGAAKAETMIVRELIPHVDATYRTIPTRDGRALQGFSMGGYGAFKLAAEYPELFRVLNVYGAALREDVAAFRRDWPEDFRTVFGGDPAYYRANDPYALLERNADRIRGRMDIRLCAGAADYANRADGGWSDAMHEHLRGLRIPHAFHSNWAGVRHNYVDYLNRDGDAGLWFIANNVSGSDPHRRDRRGERR